MVIVGSKLTTVGSWLTSGDCWFMAD